MASRPVRIAVIPPTIAQVVSRSPRAAIVDQRDSSKLPPRATTQRQKGTVSGAVTSEPFPSAAAAASGSTAGDDTSSAREMASRVTPRGTCSRTASRKSRPGACRCWFRQATAAATATAIAPAIPPGARASPRPRGAPAPRPARDRRQRRRPPGRLALPPRCRESQFRPWLNRRAAATAAPGEGR
jgi:hypothetical protein